MCSLYFEKLHFYSWKVTIWELPSECEIQTCITNSLKFVQEGSTLWYGQVNGCLNILQELFLAAKKLEGLSICLIVCGQCWISPLIFYVSPFNVIKLIMEAVSNIYLIFTHCFYYCMPGGPLLLTIFLFIIIDFLIDKFLRHRLRLFLTN